VLTQQPSGQLQEKRKHKGQQEQWQVQSLMTGKDKKTISLI